MAANEEPPGGQNRSWAQVLGSTLPPTWNKNMLEVVLEKNNGGAFYVSEADCAKLMTKIGLNFTQQGQVETVQICPNGRGVILITLKNNVSLECFKTSDVIEVTQNGIRAVMIKHAGKREVNVTIKGIHPATKDDGVIGYLAKFGKVISTRVTHLS